MTLLIGRVAAALRSAHFAKGNGAGYNTLVWQSIELVVGDRVLATASNFDACGGDRQVRPFDATSRVRV